MSPRNSNLLNGVLWAISIATATALTVSRMHAKNVAELAHGEAGLYRQLPGIIVGLLSGFLLDSPIVVIVITVAVNAAFYYCVLRLFVWLWRHARERNT